MAFASLSHRFIDETMRLVGKALGASRLAFYSVDTRDNLHDFVFAGVPTEFHRRYEREMFAYDPLHVRRIAEADPAVARLADAAEYASSDDIRTYRAFMRRFAAYDTIELVFHDEHRIRAGLNVTWTDRDPPPSTASHALAEHLQRYIQFELKSRFARTSRAELPCTFGLTAREREVARLVCKGYTNGTIATSLGVRVSTVKTHLLHVFEKCEVETRAGLVARLSERER